MKFLNREGGGRWGGEGVQPASMKQICSFWQSFCLPISENGRAGTVSKSTSGRRLRDGVEHMWTFSQCVETILN